MNEAGSNESKADNEFPYETAAEAARAVLQKIEARQEQYATTKLGTSHLFYVTALLEAQATGRITVGVPAIAEGLLKIRELAGEDCEYGLGSLDSALDVVGRYGLSVDGHDLNPELGKGHAKRVQR